MKSIKEIYEINKLAIKRLTELKNNYIYFQSIYYYPYWNFLEVYFWNSKMDYERIQISNEQFLLFFL